MPRKPKSFGKSKLSLRDAQLSVMSQAPSGFVNAESKFPIPFLEETPRAVRAPGVKNKHEEHDSQAEIVRYLRQCCPSVLVSSSANGELWPLSQQIDKGRFYGWMNKLKNRGLLTGDPDLRLTWFPSRCIFIEKKRAKGGVTSDAQIEVGARLRAQGFAVYTLAGGIDELKEIIRRENIPCRDHDVATNPLSSPATPCPAGTPPET